MSKRLLIALTACLLATGGCNIIYKQNIQQGNALDQEDLDQLRLGMSQNQVAFLLGTPSIRDPFHHDRWDYVSSFSRRGGEPVMRKITLHFEDGALAKMIGVDPDATEPQSTAAAGRDAPETAPETVAENTAPAPRAAVEAADTAPEINALEAPVAQSQDLPPVAASAAADSGDAPATTPAEASPAGAWEIQLGAFDTSENAAEMTTQLKSAGIAAYTLEQVPGNGDTRFLVRSGGLASRAAAEELLDRISREQGVRGYVVKPDTDAPAAAAVSEAPAPAEVAPTAEPPVTGATAAEAPAMATETAIEAPAGEPPGAPSPGSWQVQLGAFDLRENAENLAGRLERAGIPAAVMRQTVDDGPDRFLVRHGGLQDRAAAEAVLDRVREELGVYGFVVPPG